MQAQFPFVKTLSGGLLAVALLKIVIIIFTIDRGFDFGDEGHHLMVASNPYTYHGALWGAITDFLHPGKDITIIGCRILKILVDFLGLLILACGAYRYSLTLFSMNASLLRFCAIFLFAFLAFYIVPLCRTVSYNEYILLSIHGAFGMAFLSFSAKRKFYRGTFMFIAGMFLAFGIPAKFISGILTLLLLLIVLFVQQRNRAAWNFKNRMEDYLFLATGYFVFITLFAVAFGLSDFIEFHQAMFIKTSIIGYSPLNLIKLFIAGDLVLVKHLLLTAASTVLVLVIAGRIKIAGQLSKSPVFAIIAAGIFSIIYMQALNFHNDFNTMRYKVLALILPAVSALLILFLVNDWNRKKLWFMVVMLSLPFLALAGTSSALIEGLSQRYFSWFVLCGIILTDGLFKNHLRSAHLLLACILLVLLSYQFKKVLVDEPFMLNGSLWEQSAPMQLQNIKVDAATKRYIDETVSILTANGFHAGDTVLTQNHKSGIPYLLHARMPVCPHYFCGNAFHRWNCYCLSHFLNDERVKFVIGNYSSRPFNTDCPDNKKAWNEFSERYALIGSAFNPLVPSYNSCWEEKTFFFKLKH